MISEYNNYIIVKYCLQLFVSQSHLWRGFCTMSAFIVVCILNCGTGAISKQIRKYWKRNLCVTALICYCLY